MRIIFSPRASTAKIERDWSIVPRVGEYVDLEALSGRVAALFWVDGVVEPHVVVELSGVIEHETSQDGPPTP